MLTINETTSFFIITLVEKKTRLEMLDEIESGSVIISAHGCAPAVYKKALEKNLNIIDATCQYVKRTHDEIKKYLTKGYDVYYIGTKKHPECEGALGINSKIKLITSIDDINNIEFRDKSFIINQTTLSLYDIKILHDTIINKNKNVIISNSICMATTLRQEAVIKAKRVDLTIVVGDIMSSNTNKLYELASKNNKTIKIESVHELLDFNFEGINEVNITSGASTPKHIVDEVVEFLNTK